jgi:hypothetical protein
VWSRKRFLAVVLFTCKQFEVEAAVSFTRRIFDVQEIEHQSF